MAMKTKRQQSSIEVIDEQLVASVGALWARTVASWSRAQLATERMHITGRVPDCTTTLIN
jgi:hypothetical protein